MKSIERACKVIPGGVNSPVRAFGAVGGDPVFIDHGVGPLIFDVNGRSYIDHVLSWGALLLGHAPIEVVTQIKEAAERGLSFGAPTEAETDLAKILCTALPSLERVRLVSSGTEATMSALRLARGFTGRPLIMKFEGHYHGHSDALLVDAGSGALTFGHPSSAGVTKETAAQTVVAPFNQLDRVEELFRAHGDQLAAVIVEPVAGNMNLVLPAVGFLNSLHELCMRYGTLLIFDEVMTGFRVGWAGAQGLFKIKPDLTTLGKVVGGGLPLAAFGGRADVMEHLAPLGPVYQAGTLSGNPLAVAAGIKTLQMAHAPGLYEALGAYSKSLCDGLAEAAQAVGVPFCAQALGGMFGIYFRATAPQNYAEAMDCDKEAFKKFFHAMLRRGVYLAPSPFEAGFVSSTHGNAELQSVIQASRESFAEMQNS